MALPSYLNNYYCFGPKLAPEYSIEFAIGDMSMTLLRSCVTQKRSKCRSLGVRDIYNNSYEWIVGIAIILVVWIGLSAQTLASSHCEPLLLLIEGGGLSRDGTSIQRLSRKLTDEYRGENVTIATVDHQFFIDSALYFLDGQRKRAVTALDASNHHPIVIVGHSLGADTAYEIARRLPIDLLLTLDGVSLRGDREHLPHPGGNVKWIDVDATGNGIGPDWDVQENADRWIKDFPSSHYDVEKMFNWAKSDVDEVLRSCTRGSPRTASVDERAICDIPGVECNVTWELTDSCPSGPVIKVRFFEYDESNVRVTSWMESSVSGNGTSQFFLECKSPGHWICYGAENRPGYYWGSGLDGKLKCNDCCAACRTGIIFQSGSLTCR